MANPKLRLPGQRGRRRRSGDREEGFSRSFDRGCYEGRGVVRGSYVLTRNATTPGVAILSMVGLGGMIGGRLWLSDITTGGRSSIRPTDACDNCDNE